MERINEIVYAALLHDIGKVFQRADKEKINHSKYGKQELEKLKILDKNILGAVENHHKSELEGKKLDNDDISYIIYEADNIASASERRDIDSSKKRVFNWDVPLSNSFTTLYYDSEEKVSSYNLQVGSKEFRFNMPNCNQKVLENEYKEISNYIKDVLTRYDFENNHPNSLIYAFKNLLNYVPSSTDTNQFTDISLYEHMKLTAAIASCMYIYCEENNITNYKERYLNTIENRKEKEFIIASMDISGIQDFIYTITSKGAAKMLKARSFYLELIMEHINDEILEKLNLTRANLIYSGGGHCYILLPNTSKAKELLKEVKQNINQWFINRFGNKLYLAVDCEECSAVNLDATSDVEKLDTIFRNLSKKLNKQKMQRYSKEQLKRFLLPNDDIEEERECRICKNSQKIVYNEILESDVCQTCDYIYQLGELLSNCVNEKGTGAYITIADEEISKILLPSINGNNTYVNIYKKQEDILNTKYKRIYAINKKEFGDLFADNIATGIYGIKGSTFEEYAKKSEGIERIGVLRADVDNLGNVFKRGFINQEYGNKLNTLTRYSMISNKLSDFFKNNINYICSNEGIKENIGEFTLTNKENKGNVKVIYSGGDDLFIIGAWDEIIELAIVLDDLLKIYTSNKITMSAGIGLFNSKFPISKQAEIVARLEELSKEQEGKNSLTLLQDDDKNVFTFDRFKNGVIEKIHFLEKECNIYDNEKEKYKVDISSSLLYKLLNLYENSENPRSTVQLAYILGRLQESCKDESKEAFKHIKERLFNIMNDKKLDDINEFIMALKLIIYKKRSDNDE